MKHIIKVETLQNLPETRPLIAMDASKKLFAEGITPVIKTDTIFTYSDSTTSTSSDQTISQSSYNRNKTLTSVEIGTKATSIGEYAFSDTGLTSVVIPNGVTSIGDGAFQTCYDLTSVVIPNSVTSIGYGIFAFYGVYSYEGSLQTITVGETVYTYEGSRYFSITLGNGDVIELMMFSRGG